MLELPLIEGYEGQTVPLEFLRMREHFLASLEAFFTSPRGNSS